MRRLIILLRNILSFPKRIFGRVSPFAILQECQMDKTAAVCSGVRFYRGKLGKFSYIGNNSFIIDTQIGKFTSIAPDCYIGGASHPLDWVSTSPVFHKHKNILRKNFAYHEFQIFNKTFIGNDVWIGNKVMVKAGVTISDGAVIGMGSIVTTDIGPYEIWAGNPAKIIRKRFEDDTIEEIMKTDWWNWPNDKIDDWSNTFNNVGAFLKEIK
jgi:acetyltransferase-like isoleucine patch superfamily enzyme